MTQNHNAPEVSVIIPVYNAEKYIKRCIDSILTQGIGDLEVVAVNDASTDRSAEVLAGLAAADSRITFIDKKVNEGSMMARNTGYKAARGKYFAFVDADDFIPEGSLRKLLDKARDEQADVVVGDFELVSDEGKRTLLVRHGKFSDRADSYMRYILNGGGNSSMCGSLFARRMFDDCDYPEIDRLCYSDDRVVMTTMMVRMQPKMAWIDAVTYCYYVNYQSMTRGKLNMEKEVRILESLYYCYNLLNGMTQRFRKENDAFLARYIGLSIERGVDVRKIDGWNEDIEELVSFSGLRRSLGLRLAMHTSLCRIIPIYGKVCSQMRYRVRKMLGR